MYTWYTQCILGLTICLGGQCHNLTPQEYKITDQNAWNEGGSMFVDIDISKYAASTQTRRAGVINDHSFLEISVEARGNGGRQIRLEPGRIFSPISKSAVVGNAFQYDLDNDFTKQLSEELKISTKLAYRFKGRLNGVVFRINSVILCDGGYFDKVNDDIPGLPLGCYKAGPKHIITQLLPERAPNGQLQASFKTKIHNRGKKIGCGDPYVLLGFDAPANFLQTQSPIKSLKITNKQFNECSIGSMGCPGVFHRVDFAMGRDYDGLGQETEFEINGQLRFGGSETHIPVGIMQFHCNFGEICSEKPTTTSTTTTTTTTTSTTTTTTTSTTTKIVTSTTSTTTSMMTTSKTFYADVRLEDLLNIVSAVDKSGRRIQFDFIKDYGCSGMSHTHESRSIDGRPIDALDKALQKWRRCIQCSHSQLNCKSYQPYYLTKSHICRKYLIKNFYHKLYKNKNKNLVDDIGSCERASCQCDMAFVSDLSKVYFHEDHSNGQLKNTGMILNVFDLSTHLIYTFVDISRYINSLK